RFDCDWSSDVCSSDLNRRHSRKRHPERKTVSTPRPLHRHLDQAEFPMALHRQPARPNPQTPVKSLEGEAPMSGPRSLSIAICLIAAALANGRTERPLETVPTAAVAPPLCNLSTVPSEIQ